MTPLGSIQVRTENDFRNRQPELEAYLSSHWLTNLANFSAFVFHALPDLNWVGFYLFDGERLILGPFVGKPACTEIGVGRGVCGTAFVQKKALLVPDVEAFPGHIACDNASRSELVLPLLTQGGDIYGVLDLDSPSLNRFRKEDLNGLETWMNVLQRKLPADLATKKPWA